MRRRQSRSGEGHVTGHDESADDSPLFRLRGIPSGGARFLLGFLAPYKGRFILATLSLLGSSLAGLAFPGMTGMMIDAASGRPSGPFADIGSVTAVFILVLGAQSVFGFTRVYLSTLVAERVSADIRQKLFDRLIRLSMTFHHEHRVGELTSRLGSDVGQVQYMITTALAELVRQSILLVGGICLVTWLSPRLTLVIVTAIPLVVVIAVVFGRLLRRAGRRIQDLYASLNTIAEESLAGIAAVKAFTAERAESQRYNGAIVKIIALSVRMALARGGFAAFISFVIFGGIVGIVWYGGVMVTEGLLTIGELTSFVLYALFVGAALGSFADLYGSFQGALGASERIRSLFEETEEDVDAHGTLIVRGEIEFDHVAFEYPTRPDVAVLKDVSFCIPAGKSLAIVGASGSGKSTIASLLMRFHNPTSGRISVDGIDSRDYALGSYRMGIAIVPQDVLLFGGTILDNIAYGRPGATYDEILGAARMANALSFIEAFPDQFDTVVGERGVQLSGGQRQRIAIARAVLKDPAILVLDEATSSLDSESEKLVQEALERAMVGRTTIIIAHRLSTVRNADAIAVIRDGAIVEAGKYADLVEAGGFFARLVAVQSGPDNDLLDVKLQATDD